MTATAGPAQASVSFATPASDGGSSIVAYTVTSSPGGQTATGADEPDRRRRAHAPGVHLHREGDEPVGRRPSRRRPSGSVTPAGLPGAPTGVGATAAADGHATVTFAPPADNGGATVTTYTAIASPGGRTGSSSGSPITVNGLTNGVIYTFTVTATNSVGIGAASSASSPVRFRSALPGAPTAVTATRRRRPGDGLVHAAREQRRGRHHVVHGDLVARRPERERLGQPDHGDRADERHDLHVHRHRDELAGRARPRRRRTRSCRSTCRARRPPSPRPPATVGDRRVHPARDNGGSAIVSYTATASPGGRVGISTGGPVTVTGLTNGVSYTFTVTATNAAGAGPASSASNAVVPPAPAHEHPEPPSGLPRPDVPPFVAPGTRPPKPTQPRRLRLGPARLRQGLRHERLLQRAQHLRARLPSSTGTRPPSSSRASPTRPAERTMRKPKSSRKSAGKTVLCTRKRS